MPSLRNKPVEIHLSKMPDTILFCVMLQDPQIPEASISSSVTRQTTTELYKHLAPEDEPLEEPKPLRPLTSLNWPYVPEESVYPDPLERDDPKPLQLRHYEAIGESYIQFRCLVAYHHTTATSPTIRRALASHPNLPAVLTSIDQLKGTDRDRALQQALGVTAPEIIDSSKSVELDEDTIALRALAEAVEAAVREDKNGALGLDWDG
ncbi:hypothetical protein D9758_001383 [Tetrapyrgos nigripes]|uniref:Uncharacterized protein n=1 Tax=Tetrapyrgos nigripes TaxID=182062 RepID=A0A8H5GSF9_9AGAR|nr:hypothetical protein D9758_001383 [Tetrapyrgos nigripes]